MLAVTPLHLQSGRRNYFCEEKSVKVMKDVVEQLITAQQESDERFMLLAEKMKIEERQIQREERERKEDREFKGRGTRKNKIFLNFTIKILLKM